MIIELKEHELPKGKKIFDVDAYNGNGLFLVNDGITMNIVVVPKLGDVPMAIPIPFNEAKIPTYLAKISLNK